MKSKIYAAIMGVTVILGAFALIRHRHSGPAAQPFPGDLRDAVSDAAAQRPAINALETFDTEDGSGGMPVMEPVKPELQASPEKEFSVYKLPNHVSVNTSNTHTVYFGGAQFAQKAEAEEALAFWVAIHEKAGINIKEAGKTEVYKTKGDDGYYTFRIGYDGKCPGWICKRTIPNHIQIFSGLVYRDLSAAEKQLGKVLSVLESAKVSVMYAKAGRIRYGNSSHGYIFRVYYLVDMKEGDRLVSREILTTGCSVLPDDIHAHFNRVVKLLEGNGARILSAGVVEHTGYLGYVRPEREDRDIVRIDKHFRTWMGGEQREIRKAAQEMKKDLERLSASKDTMIVGCGTERIKSSELLDSDTINTKIDYIKKAE